MTAFKERIDGWRKEPDPKERLLNEIFEPSWFGLRLSKLSEQLWGGYVGEDDPPETKYPFRVHLGTGVHKVKEWWVSRQRVTRRHRQKV